MPAPPSAPLRRVLALPVFPAVSDDGVALETDPFSPNALLGGFVAGPENRLAELAVRFAVDGVPVFERPLGETFASNDATRLDGAPSRDDLETLFRQAANGETDADFDAIFDRAAVRIAPRTPERPPTLFSLDGADETTAANDANAVSRRSTPNVVGWRPLEEASFFTPLVFYGPSGSGKTRLVEGICQSRRLAEPNKTLYYLSGADFARSLTNAIRRDQTQIFRTLLGQARVVAIENADVLAERDAAQSEFLPILDAAVRDQKLVIVSLSKNPNEIAGFSPELAARLGAGLLIPTRFPTRETKRFIVERAAAKLGLRLDEATLEFCVDNSPASVGGLCGTLVQAAQEFATRTRAPSPENFRAIIEARNPEPTWTLDRVLKAVAKQFSVSVVEMRSKKRSKTLVLARNVVFYLARKLTDATFQEIGREFSNRDHSTTLRGARDVAEALETDAELRFQVREIVEKLRAEERVKL
ncbi:MAG: AAA family ATPase [Thermoguttaceae bacterium]|nr:AAA family ATPase [Thermoguttaceae bacterium]MBQ6828105.1 AAA family ATPase [Thermoguttaceae bacterium]